MNGFKAMILDDEADAVSLLQIQLSKHCPQITNIMAFTNPAKALNEIEVFKPDLVFLDIEMPVISGFEFLRQLMPLNFAVIFITAYNQFALKAFKFNALDYLVKPIEINELKEAVEKAENSIRPGLLQLTQLQNQIRGGMLNKIAISTQTGISFIDLNDIMYAEASNNYTRLVLTDDSVLIISKTLKDVQDLLEESHFLRIHRQYIINLNKVKHLNRLNYTLTMINKTELPVARNQKDKLIEKYGLL